MNTGIIPIHNSKDSKVLGYTSITVPNVENSFDIILEGEDYTVGYLLEYYVHKTFYKDTDLQYIL